MTRPNLTQEKKVNVTEDRIHVAISNDGTRIAGRVHGQGPPLVLVHGGLGDGEFSWRFLLPFLVDHFTCYAVSTRGRGLSDDNPDHSRERHYEDVAAFIESIGEPVAVFAHSMGAAWALGGAGLAADRTRRIALYEPPAPATDVLPDLDLFARVMAAIADDKLDEVVRLTVTEALELNEDEQAIFLVPPGSEIAKANIRAALMDSPELARPTDDVVFENLEMPVLLLQGTKTGDGFRSSIQQHSERIADDRVVDIPGVGHMGPLTAPEAVARELVEFFRLT